MSVEALPIPARAPLVVQWVFPDAQATARLYHRVAECERLLRGNPERLLLTARAADLRLHAGRQLCRRRDGVEAGTAGEAADASLVSPDRAASTVLATQPLGVADVVGNRDQDRDSVGSETITSSCTAQGRRAAADRSATARYRSRARNRQPHRRSQPGAIRDGAPSTARCLGHSAQESRSSGQFPRASVVVASDASRLRRCWEPRCFDWVGQVVRQARRRVRLCS